MILYNYLIVGAGFYGAICAHELKKAGYSCLVIDKRNHIGGNCYTENRDNINIHLYGPHIFHTSNEDVWNWINQFVKFNDFTLRPVANYKGEIYSLPFNMWTFNKLWGVTHPEQARNIIKLQSSEINEPSNLEEQAIKLVGIDVYEKLIKGYTKKQWRKDPKQLPKEIIKRLPVRFTYDNNYFNDKYQGIPIGGYTQIFEKLLTGIDTQLNVDYLNNKHYYDSVAEKVIYTGPIDAYFDYRYGHLEYKTTDFQHFYYDKDNHQGTAMMNYTDEETKWTRIIEHKHFEFVNVPGTWISYEYPIEYNTSKEPYYPVNDEENNAKYLKYKALASLKENIIFGGRLAEYKYYDMHQVIESALTRVKQEIYDNTNRSTSTSTRN